VSDDELIDPGKLIELPRRHARHKNQRPRSLPRAGLFIPAALVRLHEGSDGEWFGGLASNGLPDQLGA
jgi:hypothetical protein